MMEAAGRQFDVPTDELLKSTEFKPFKLWKGIIPLPHIGKSKKTNPHMRGFWAATVGFCLAFIGWFAFAPLMIYVRKDLGFCDNNDEVQLDIENVDCVCEAKCKEIDGSARMASVSFDIVLRFFLGTVLEFLGPVRTNCALLILGSFFVAMGATVQDATGLIVIRFFVSVVGPTFVVNQFWNSILFASNVKGTANATAGGWGNLGGGLTQILMPGVYMFFHDTIGMSMGSAWRASMSVPSVLFLICAAFTYFGTQDMPTGRFNVSQLGKTTKAGPMTYLQVLSDYRVVLMIFQYGTCFGSQLVMHNVLHTHFHDYFHVSASEAGFLAFSYGGMNLWARSSGGIFSDWMNVRYGMRGRLWAHFISLFLGAIFLFLFSLVDKDMGWSAALPVLMLFSQFCNMAEGTTYGIVPFMIPMHMAVVSAVVGAGGTMGALVLTSMFYRTGWDNKLEPFRWHALVFLVSAISVLPVGWRTLGSMWRGAAPQEEEEKLEGDVKKADEIGDGGGEEKAKPKEKGENGVEGTNGGEEKAKPKEEGENGVEGTNGKEDAHDA